jgi:hypothetical protein
MKKITDELSKYLIIVKKESHHTRAMVITFKRLLHKQLGGKSNPTEEEVKEAIMQLKDVGKITALLPLIALPGSILTIPVLIKIGKYYNIDILPKIKK